MIGIKKGQRTRFELGFIFAIVSAIYFSLNVPVSKILLENMSAYWLASLLYFGAGIGTYFFHKLTRKKSLPIQTVTHHTFCMD
ncbi:MAG: EamA family transporter [Firmicutes bacterium]|nr:EamA family transporter [Bacillota bacterium]